MPHEPLRCRHIHTEGRQCGSPALRGEKLCFHHHAARRPARAAHNLPVLPDPEDLHAVQRGLAELLRLVARELIADKQAKHLFAILAQAGTNLARIDRARRAERTLALAEARFAARHPEASFSVRYSRRESASVPATEADLVTDPVHDPELGLIAPGPDPEPAPEHPTLTTVPSSLEWDAPIHPERPTPARQDEIDAEAAAEAEFQRLEQEAVDERRRLRDIAREVMYPLLTPAARARQDAARAAEQYAYDHPELAVYPYLLQNVRSTPENPQNPPTTPPPDPLTP